jgi:hypothetical protein
METDSGDSASDMEGHECAATKSDDDIVDETVSPSPMKNRIRSKAWKVTIPAPKMCSESEDEEHRVQVLHVPKGCVCVKIRAPCRFSPPGNASYAEGQVAVD